MKTKSKRNKKRTNPGSERRGILLVAVFLTACTILFGPQVINLYHMNQEIKVLESQKRALAEQNERYKQQIKELESDQALEKLAREELGMIKPGEKLLVKVLPTGQSAQY